MSFPFFGEEFSFPQPDGTRLAVRGWGDQNSAVFETLDGFTVVRDPITGFYHYAALTPDGSDLRPSGVRPGTVAPQRLNLQAGVRRSVAVADALAEAGVGLPKPHWQTRRERRRQRRLFHAAGIAPAPPQRDTVGDFVGLCLLIQFPDVAGTITQAEVTSFCNQVGYAGFGNNGSVHDYFHDNSLGRLRYTTVVTPYYTAAQPRDYYTNPLIPYGDRARELILEALTHHAAAGFDFSQLTPDADGNVYATSVFSAGTRVNQWNKGLWPHASRLLAPFVLGGGLHAYDYQITDMTATLQLGTYCHENGHMLCDFPDLYDYGAPGIRSSGIGPYCLMCAGGNADQFNPVQVCAYLKRLAGWANSVTPLTAGMHATATAGTNDFFIHQKNAFEYFLVENRQRSGRDAALPASGLTIWHVDEFGNNSREQMTAASHYECSLEQADGLFNLERGFAGDINDLFHQAWRARFADGTLPDSKWWDGSASNLDLFNFGLDGVAITFEANV